MPVADLKLDTITCQKCGEVIPVSEALSHQVVEKARAQIRAEALQQESLFASREQELLAREDALNSIVEERVLAARSELSKHADEAARAALAMELEDLRRQTDEKSSQLRAAQESELTLRQEKRALEERERALELEVSRRLDEEGRRVEEATAKRLEEEHRTRDADKDRRLEEALAARDAKEREFADREAELHKAAAERVQAVRTESARQAEEAARTEVATELEDLRRQAEEKGKLLTQAREAELALRQEKRSLEEREKALTLEVARRLEEEARRVEEATAKRLEEEHRLRDAEKDKRLQDAQRMNDELRRKLQQGSQQTQGEVLEIELETLLTTAFPMDGISPVPKGVNGGDVVHKVVSGSGQHCGTILWEAKRTKNWSDGWLGKLKDDQRSLKAELAVIVSEALPKDCQHFSQVRGVWVTSPQCALSLATALRFQLKEVAMTKLAAVGKNDKMEVLHGYLSGPEFRQRVEAIVKSFTEMQKDLQEEQRSAMRRWAKREKLLQKVIGSTSGMYGDLQGLIGSSLQTIPALSDSGESAVTSSPQPPPNLIRDVEAAALDNIELGRGDLIEEVDEGEEESFSLRDFNQPRATERQAL